MYLFFDTETTGLPKDYKSPATDSDNWPRLVQLAWLVYDNDGVKISGDSCIIKPERSLDYPDGFPIPEDVQKIHGITTERAILEGKPLKSVMLFLRMLLVEAHYIVGHNIEFDENIVAAEFYRLGIDMPLVGSRLCTMHGSVDYCALPKDGKPGFKWPKLTELHEKLFGAKFEGAHKAAVDIEATAKCFWELRRLKVI